MATANPTVTDTIIEQLGGARFAVMTGASFFVSEIDRCVNVKFAGSGKANFMQVTLELDDTYTVSFSQTRGLKMKNVSKYYMVHATDLQWLFTNVTGLLTRL